MLNNYTATIDKVYQYIIENKAKNKDACINLLCATRDAMPVLYSEPMLIFSYIELGMYECAFLTALEYNATLYAYPLDTVKWLMYGAGTMSKNRRDVVARAIEYLKGFDADKVGSASSQAHIPVGWGNQLATSVQDCHLAYLMAYNTLTLVSTNILIGDALRKGKKASDEFYKTMEQIQSA